ncbi:hypothetical protein CHS0354_000545 [Potamilus streckersoni]|uniref:isoleucine--tRNA ligase n=1 Tax=Potamilus streckersoni TaxID=2493646 RepID=A0AAE0T6X2_9BIVA|nr:hypothetical protein CHS0354_000545 [Potamilus streckersoni]
MSKFREYSQAFSYGEIEKQILLFWHEHRIFEQSVKNRSESPIFSFCEGPPTVNGLPAIHHVFSRAVKDVVCRYKTQAGFCVRRQAGWDTHGLPVEISVEKKLGLKSNSEVVNFGIDAFCNEAQRMVHSHINDSGLGWGKLTRDMGYWCDMERAYITCDNNYIESVWWSIHEIFKKNLIYKDYKIVPQDPKSESVLSTHELALGYKEVKDPSIYVKFKRKNLDEYFLAWTTTPWTLISNLFLAVHPKVEYVKAKVTLRHKESSETSVFVIAKDRLSIFSDNSVDILETFLGETLEHSEYEPLYPYFYSYHKSTKRAHFVALADFVTVSDGTGIVHCAPGFGADDYATSKIYHIPMFQPVSRSGHFTLEAPLVEGKFFKDADPIIIDDLRSRRLLFRKETIIHTYPFSWRYDVPVMYYARESWFIRTSSLATVMAERNKDINWIPQEIGTGRFGNWLAENKDWALSRNRFWGTPLPIWIRDDFEIGDSLSEKAICIGSLEQLKEGYIDINGNPIQLKEALINNLVTVDLHKPFTDRIYFVKNGKTYRRTPEVIDVWYDSGAAPFAQFHFPFENKEIFEKNYPIDFISEGIDQTRGWFYTLHAIGTMVFDKLAFKNVASLGLLLDKSGQKMSKSKGNVIDPFKLMEKYGADTVRWYLLSSAPTWQSNRFNEDDLAETQRKFFRAYLESYKFFAMYANLDSFNYSEPILAREERTELDQWILSRLHSLIKSVKHDMDNFLIHSATQKIEALVVNDLSNWFIRRSRRRFWKEPSDDPQQQEKLSAYQTLYECLFAICKLAAPFAPFLPDEIYQNLNTVSKLEPFASVHLTEFPNYDENTINLPLEQKVKKSQVISSLVRTMREKASLKVRQPLNQILIVISSDAERREIESQKATILDEVNVKSITYIQSDSGFVKKSLKPNFKALGPKCGKYVNQVTSLLKNFSNEEISHFEQNRQVNITINQDIFNIERQDVDIMYHDIEGWLIEHDSQSDLTIALDTTLTTELIEEGIAREFISKIQNYRKALNLNVTDKIEITVETTSNNIINAINHFKSYIVSETLANSINFTSSRNGTSRILEKINGEPCYLKIES